MMKEVEFKLVPTHGLSMNEEAFTGISFEIPMHHPPRSSPNQIYTSDPTYIQISPQQVGSYVVHYLMTLTRKYLGHDNIKSAVIAVPAKFDTVQRAATVEAFRLAGIQVARILEEPVAAALAYGLQKKANVDYIIVYDFGGGTLDVSILQVSKDGYVEVMGSDGDENLGGADFDAAVAHYLLDGVQGKRKEVNRVMAAVQVVKQQQWTTQKHEVSNIDFEEKLLSECPVLHEWPLCTLSSFHTISEQMKIELSSHEVGGGTVSKVCLGFPSSEGLSWEPPQTMGDFCSQLQPLTLTLTPEEYDLACHSLYDRSMLPIRRLLGDLELGAKDIDEVVMVGGTTRMPKIRKMVRDELFISDLNTHIDPDLTVAIGAASVID
jgi:molecular chaperone DnaK (HSP70)